MDLSLEEASSLVTSSNKNTSLDIRGKDIRKLPDLSSLCLHSVLCKQNQLDNLKAFLHCKQLKSLNVENNRLSKISFRLDQLTNLRVLNASNNDITQVKGLLNVPLEALVLSENQLTSIPKDLPSSINSLVLSKNQIKEIAGLEKLARLQKLTLSGNKIAALSDSIKSNSALTELRLNNNQLIRVPPALLKNIHLRLLDLGNNRIPDKRGLETITSLTHLKNLNIMGNPACENEPDVEKWLCDSLPSLRIFNSRPIPGRTPFKRKAQGGDSPKNKRTQTDKPEGEPSPKKFKSRGEDFQETKKTKPSTRTLSTDQQEAPPSKKQKTSHVVVAPQKPQPQQIAKAKKRTAPQEEQQEEAETAEIPKKKLKAKVVETVDVKKRIFKKSKSSDEVPMETEANTHEKRKREQPQEKVLKKPRK